MSLIENYFGKSSIENITYDDIVSFFSEEKKESDRIEFKSFDPREKQGGKPKTEKEHFETILESIVAFLNSDGGMLIWGSPAGIIKQGDKEKTFIGDPIPIPYKYEDDQIVRKITDKINPIPNRVRKKIIQKDSGFIYLFEIEKSEYSPHQVNDKFYMRIDGATKIAPYHYIDALFKKIKYPDIRGYIKVEHFSAYSEPFSTSTIYQLRLGAIISNLSKLQNDYNVYYSILCNIGQFNGWQTHMNSNNSIRYDQGGNRITNLNSKDVLYYGELLIDKWTLNINPYELQNNNNEINIIFSFGAKHSPMKISTYKLRLDINIKEDFNKRFYVEINENVLMSDHINNIGTSDQDFIESVLGRK